MGAARSSAIRRLGVLTGGGDCPGLNAVIRAITRASLSRGIDVVGIEDGFLGLVEDRMRPLAAEDVAGILSLGGTILGSCNRTDPGRVARGKSPDGTPRLVDAMDECLAVLSRRGIDALAVVGGDGSMSVADRFVRRGVPVIGVPKTIDNDLVGTDLTFGHATAVETATEALDRVRTTAASHHRVLVVEVMGRNAGWLALGAGIASGAEVILIPELPYREDTIARVIRDRAARGRRHTILCVAEGARPEGGTTVVDKVDPTRPDPIRLGGVGRVVAEAIERLTGVESRCVILGHVQRGGAPIASDRILATRFGVRAAEMAAEGRFNRLVAWRGGAIGEAALSACVGAQRLVTPDEPLLRVAREAGASFGVPE